QHFYLEQNYEDLLETVYDLNIGSSVRIYFKTPYFIWRVAGKTRSINSGKQAVDDFINKEVLEDLYERADKEFSHGRSAEGMIQKIIGGRYNVLHRVETMGINSNGNLTIGTKELVLDRQNQTLKLSHIGVVPEGLRAPIDFEKKKICFSENTRIWCKRGQWNDGSIAIVDGQGLVHLKSSDESIPEITFLSVINTPTAAWCSDGLITGNNGFSLRRPMSIKSQ
ncbi:MAG: hypothetical protein JKY54_19270, partial [Flavobacteriales bacterium]|nr:hypothetical protein [Flavobacteriales bacterium]